MKTIEIRTAQNIVIEFTLADTLSRALAFMLDNFIILGTYWIFTIFFLSLNASWMSETNFAEVILMVSFLGLYMLYFFLLEILFRGQTLGKKALQIRTVRIDGSEAKPGDYLLRSFFCLFDGLMTLGSMGGLLIQTSAHKQRLGDLAANTTVIKTLSHSGFSLNDILSIKSLENYTPIYPAVRTLSEKDMLLIKTTLLQYQATPNEAHLELINLLTENICTKLNISIKGQNIEFLRTLIKDYVVLTR
jgi:uncharacterized RDD family membrane protein YckC